MRDVPPEDDGEPAAFLSPPHDVEADPEFRDRLRREMWDLVRRLYGPTPDECR